MKYAFLLLIGFTTLLIGCSDQEVKPEKTKYQGGDTVKILSNEPIIYQAVHFKIEGGDTIYQMISYELDTIYSGGDTIVTAKNARVDSTWTVKGKK